MVARRMPGPGRCCRGGWPVTIVGRLCADQGASDSFSGGESNDGGGEGYESTGETTWVFVALGGVILICRLWCGCERANEGGTS